MLLTIVVNGTAGPDEINFQVNNNVTEIFVNSQLVVSTSSESIFTVNGLDGNDHIVVSQEDFGEHVTVNGGAGNDVIEASDTRFGLIHGTIDLLGGSGTDELIVNDTADTAPTPFYIDNTGMGLFNGQQHVLTVENDIESQFINLGNGNDTIEIGSTQTGMHVDGGGGNDTFDFGGGDHIIPPDLDPSTFTGGAGADKALFDDSGRTLVDETKTYTIAGQGALGQTLSGFETLELDTARSNGFLLYVYVAGNPGVGSIILNNTPTGSSNNLDTLTLGTAATPIDFDNFGATITCNMLCDGVQLFDQDANLSNNPWIFYTTTASGGTQVIQKGSMTLGRPHVVQGQVGGSTFTSINAGSSDDTFEFASELPTHYFGINGGAGDDSVFTTNFAGSNHADDLAAVFQSGLTFDGQDGNDFLALNDSLAPASNSVYKVFAAFNTNSSFVKNGVTLVSLAPETTEDIRLTADAGNDAIGICSANSHCALTFDGGPGDDVFFNDDSAEISLASWFGPCTVVGGTGNDTLNLDDRANTDNANYFLGTSLFQGDRGRVTFDATLENLLLNEADTPGTTHLNAKLPGMHVSIFGNNGNDTFIIGAGDLDSNGYIGTTTLDGGGGAGDSIEFDDHSDVFSTTETETYNFNTGTLDKGSVDVAYANFESQKLDASTTDNSLPSNGELVNLNTNSVPTTIIGGFNRFCVINVGFADLSPVAAPVTLTMGGAGGAIVNDQNSTGDKSYTLSPTQFTASSGQVVNFSGAGITLNANGGNNAIAVTATVSGEPFVINANGGNDTISLGGGNIDQNILVVPTIDGGAGTDTLAFDNSADAAAESLTLNSSGFTDGMTFGFGSNIEALAIKTGPGGGTSNLDQVPLPTTFTGGTGNDVVNVGAGNLDANLISALSATGGAGTDSLLLDDHSDTGDDFYTFNTTNVFHKGTLGKTVSANFNSYTLSCNRGNNGISALGSLPVTVLGNAGNDTLDAEGATGGLTPPRPNVTFDGGAGLDVVDVNTNNVGTAIVHFDNTQDLSSLSIGTGGVAIANAGANLVLNTPVLTLAPANSLLDLNDNDLLLDYTGTSKLSSIVASIRSARSGGAWNGTVGITSTSAKTNSLHNTTLGAIEAGDFKNIYGATANFDGQPTDTTAVLVKYTYYGDTDFNGKVNFDDYVRADAGFNNHRTGWMNGDFDLNGSVNFDDYVLIDQAFNSQGGTL
jgi:hypothetical protein